MNPESPVAFAFIMLVVVIGGTIVWLLFEWASEAWARHYGKQAMILPEQDDTSERFLS